MAEQRRPGRDGGGRGTGAEASREEQERERYRELLDELRTVIPGVQVLFGFLLVAPFSSRFGDLDPLGTHLFVVTLVTTAIAAIVFVAPAPYHRLRGPRHRDERIRAAVRLQLAGIALLGVATTLAVFVVTRFVLGGTWTGTLLGLVTGTAALVLWAGLPLARRWRTASGGRPGGSRR